MILAESQVSKRKTKDYFVRFSTKTYSTVYVRARNEEEAAEKAHRKVNRGYGITIDTDDQLEVEAIMEDTR